MCTHADPHAPSPDARRRPPRSESDLEGDRRTIMAMVRHLAISPERVDSRVRLAILTALLNVWGQEDWLRGEAGIPDSMTIGQAIDAGLIVRWGRALVPASIAARLPTHPLQETKQDA